MRKIILISSQTALACTAVFLLASLTGCQTEQHSSAAAAQPTKEQPTAAKPTAPAAAPVASAPKPALPLVRIKAGLSSAFTDSSGNVWQPDQGFDGGDVIDRDPGTSIANTKDPGIFLTEHYGMSGFSYSVPNGKYLARLYFAETFDGVTGVGQRVFSFNVQGHEFKDFDVWVKAGGPYRAYVESVPVEVTDGKFHIIFTSNVENPEINAIELVPQS